MRAKTKKQERGFEGRGRSRRFTDAFRRQAEKLLRKAILSGGSASGVAAQLGDVVTPQTLCLWVADLVEGDAKLRKAWRSRPRGGRKLKRAA